MDIVEELKLYSDEIVHLILVSVETGLYSFSKSGNPDAGFLAEEISDNGQRRSNLANVLVSYVSEFSKIDPVHAVLYLSLLSDEVNRI